jgi:anti-sigma-K factor RskA
MTGNRFDLDHDRLRDELAAFALGALDEAEAAELQRHLDECESCRARLRWLTPAVDVLPASVTQRTPPDRLRERLMEVVSAESASVADGIEQRPETTARRARASLAARFGVVRVAALAAATALAIGVGVGYLLDDGGGGSTSRAGTLSQARALNGTSQVSATLERDGDSAILHVQSLPALARNQVYEVWVRRAGSMEPRSLFVLSRNGSGEAAIPGPLSNADTVFVTAEPRGGSVQPTSAPVLRAPL